MRINSISYYISDGPFRKLRKDQVKQKSTMHTIVESYEIKKERSGV